MISQWWRPVIEIGVFSVLFYYSFLFLKGTRAYQVLKGMTILLLTYALAKSLDLTVITFILGKFFGVAIIAFVVLFQSELRRALAAIGRSHFDAHAQGAENIVEVLLDAVSLLKEKYIGALIVIMRENSLKPFMDTGVAIDSICSVELFLTIFTLKTPLHDGAVIIDGNRIMAAACLLPLSQRGRMTHAPMGTRHRAAIGLTEETDALVLIVSEENGYVSIAEGGKIDINVSMNHLKNVLLEIYNIDEQKKKNVFKQFIQRIFQR